MNRITKLIIICAVVLLLGLSITCFGLVADPFSLPFQDFTQMPPEEQLVYQTRSAIMHIVQITGGLIAAAAALTVLVP